MIDRTLRTYAGQDTPPSRLQADDVLVRARRAHRRRRAATVTGVGGLTAVLIAGTVALTRLAGGPPAVVVPGVTVPAPAACAITALPKPAGVAAVTATDADPTGRFVLGRPADADDMAPAEVILWTDGTPRLLPTGFAAAAVSSAGLVVGTDGLARDRRAAFLRDGQVVDLPVPAGAESTQALDVNSAGQVAGVAGYPNGVSKALLWPSRTEVRVLPGADTWAAGLAEDGTVVGTLGDRHQPYVWSPGGTGTALPLPDGYHSGEGMAIAGDWVTGTLSTGVEGKGGPTGKAVFVRWNLRTGTVETGFRIVPAAIAPDGTIGGRIGGSISEPAIWRDGAVVPLPRLGAEPGLVAAVTTDGHTMIGTDSDGTGSTAVVWRGC